MDYSRQITDLQKLADKNGFTVVATLTAKEFPSKTASDKEVIHELTQLAQNGKIQKVLTAEVSRLGRNPLENVKLLEELHAHHVSILSQDMDAETLTPEGNLSTIGRILHNVFLSIYKQETIRHSERVNGGLDEARRKGTILGRPKGSHKSEKDILKEYAGVVKDLKKGLPVVEVARFYSIDAKTVRKVKKLLQ
jgi:DNA invertase Pin-like site-specific DNA recombinase